MPTAQNSPTVSAAGKVPGLRIGFFASFPFHVEILRPIHALLERDFTCLLTADVEALIEFQPQILLVSDRFLPRHRQRLPNALLIFTRHGFISKNYAWGVFGESDFVCISSRWVRDDCVARGWLPRLGYWITGFVPMDKVLADRVAGRTPDLPAGFSRSGPTLLYAPTFHRSLNSVEMLGTDWIRRLRERWPELNVILKPHPHTAERSPESMAIIRELAASNERTLLVPSDANIYDWMPMADLMVSDASSVAFFFLAWDRPIILVNNPRRFHESEFFDPDGQEWTWRDMAVEIEHAEALPEAMQICLDHPEQKAERIAFYRDRVFGGLLDGQSAARIADKVRALVNPTAEDESWVEIAWNCFRTIRQLQKQVDQLPPPNSPKPVTVDLKQHPHLRAAVNRDPAVRAELVRIVGRALREQAGGPHASPVSPPITPGEQDE